MKTLATIFATIVATISLHAELTIVSTEHRDASYFKRLSEYFTGKENPGRYSIVRTEPASRDGFYVSLKASGEVALENIAAIRLQYIPAGTQEITTIDLSVDSIEKRRILVGFTGHQWSGTESRPIAWKIELLSTNGATLDSAQSFLWSM